MADYEFSTDDVNALGVKLDSLQPELSEREQALLLTIFRLAGEQLESSTEVAGFAFGGAFRKSFPSAGLPRFSIGLVGLGADGPADGSAPPPPPPSPPAPGPAPGGFL